MSGELRRLGGRSWLFCLSLALYPATARAECAPGAADISWVRLEGAEICPTAARIRADVARRLAIEIRRQPLHRGDRLATELTRRRRIAD